MEVTLLGSGDAVGVPAPLCDCEYCLESERRRRPGLLVRTDEVTVLFDCSPDVTEQLHEVGVVNLDAVFVTHAHYDHFHGVHELNHAVLDRHVLNEADYEHPTFGKDVPVYGSTSLVQHVVHTAGHLTEHLDFHRLDVGDSVSVGDLTVIPFPVHHGEPAFSTQGYVVEQGDSTVGYAPDVNRLGDDLSMVPTLDVLFFESLLGPELHAHVDDLETELARVDAERVVPTNVSEHMAEMHTEEVQAVGERRGYEVWDDFDSVSL